MAQKEDEVSVLFRTSLRNTVYDVMSSNPGWEEADNEDDWDIHWADVGWIRENFDKIQFDDHQVRSNIREYLFDIQQHANRK